ncbi:MAG: S23 ribosomal protein family protein [Parcubacteria group bacterium GW2011_GWC2_45_7]|nr:MAG: S23 ribosomal protein family protein [Parcubacteria group bacterium GW2011_GWC2_45_7]KKU73822.1 MAG: S23 ribosomal protein family protein [Parcubacteria group bacterium GW2011_GWA2_47_26]
MVNSYKDLTVWQKSYDVVIKVYGLTRSFPKEEAYGLTSQIRRAAVAIPSNIAEGHTRGHRGEFIQFLNIAFASGAELETQLLLAKDLQYLPEPNYFQVNVLLTEVMKMLNGLITKLKTSP